MSDIVERLRKSGMPVDADIDPDVVADEIERLRVKADTMQFLVNQRDIDIEGYKARLTEAEALCSFLASAWFYGNWRPESYVERQQQACMERLGWWPIIDEDDLIKRVAQYRDNGIAPDSTTHRENER